MGLAVLPARLKNEMNALKDAILNNKDYRNDKVLQKHADWVDEFKGNYKEINEANIDSILQEEIGKVFEQVLEDAGVYKCDEDGLRAFLRFIAEVNS